MRFDPTLGSNNLGLKKCRIRNHHIFGIARTSAFIWHIWIPLKKFCKRTRRVCVCIVLVHFGRYSQEVNEKSVKLAVWAVSLNFLHDFTLFVVDIHQIRLISLFRHFPNHFHFHGSAGLIPKVNLSLRPMMMIWRPGRVRCGWGLREKKYGWDWQMIPTIDNKLKLQNYCFLSRPLFNTCIWW